MESAQAMESEPAKAAAGGGTRENREPAGAGEPGETGGAAGNGAVREVREKRRIAGGVQGVGFRAATREAALRAGVRGWAKNESDGSVTVLMLGSESAVAEVDDFLRRGPPSARVAGAARLMLEKEDEKADPEGFGIL